MTTEFKNAKSELKNELKKQFPNVKFTLTNWHYSSIVCNVESGMITEFRNVVAKFANPDNYCGNVISDIFVQELY